MTFPFLLLDFFVPRRRAARSQGAQEAYGQGHPVSIAISVSGLTKLTNSWIPGVLEVEPGVLGWYAFGVLKTLIRAETFNATGLRQVRQSEGWLVGTKSLVLMGEFDNKIVELALQEDELAMVLDAVGANHLLR